MQLRLVLVELVCRFDVQENSKWGNPLMGWTSGSDTHGTQLVNTLLFASQ
jgi:hypothetical protein